LNKVITENKTKILVVEDNEDLLFNMEMTLEFNGYEVVTAKNGREALAILSNSQEKNVPDLIISDIMMPDLDGYQFFDKISEDPRLGLIPFIFVSARASPDDIKFGKSLGVDDYLTKPLDFDLLLAIIAGKISRAQKSDLIRKKIEENMLSSLKIDSTPSLSKSEKIAIVIVNWNDIIGPELKNSYPKGQDVLLFHETIGTQLFQAAKAIYGQTGLFKAQTILLNVENFGTRAYIYFDSIKDSSVRGGQRLFMIAIISSNISYFESLKLNDILKEISSNIKRDYNWYEKDIDNLKTEWNRLIEIL